MSNVGMNDRKTNIAFTVAATIAFAVLLFVASTLEQTTFSSLLSLAIVGAVTFLIVSNLVQSDGTISISIRRPMPLYGMFYLLYYVFPFLTLYFAQRLPDEKELVLALLFLVGYIGWRLGSMHTHQSESRINTSWIDRAEAKALLVVCVLGIAMTIFSYMSRLRQGNFFYQATYIEQDLSLADSLTSVVAPLFQLPIILLLGLLSSIRHEDIAGVSRKLLIGYGTAISLILVLSSQTRPAITAMIFLYLATRFYRKEVMTLWQMIVLGVAGLAGVVIIQGLRIISAADFDDAPNQFLFALQNAIPNALSLVTSHQEELGDRLLSRGSGAIAFLGEVVAAIDDRGEPFYGQGIFESLIGLVPRFMWLDKPAIASPQAVVQGLLGYSETYDASVSPITQFYFEGGWIGVIGGYMLFGWAMTWLTRQTVQSRSVGLWIVLCFIWGHVSNIEFELVVGGLGALRTSLFVYLLWWLLVLVLGGSSPHHVRRK